VQTHLKITAILFVLTGAVLVTLALFSSVLLGTIAFLVGTSRESGAPLGAALLGMTGVTLTIVLLAFAAPCILCGWGLLRHKPWARTLGIILAAISLIQWPAGTLFGVYALWVLFNRETELLFRQPHAGSVSSNR
jgi:hypothetical protein